MLTPVIKNIREEQLEQNSIIPTTIIYIDIENWVCNLVNLFRYMVTLFIPTKRINILKFETNDTKNIFEMVSKPITSILLKYDCPLGEIKLDYTNKDPGPESINIKSDMFKYTNSRDDFSKYSINQVLMTLKPTCNLKIHAEVVEDTAIDTFTYQHKFATIFSRLNFKVHDEKGTPFKNLSSSDIEYNSGTISFKHQSGKNMKQIFTELSKIMKDYFYNIRDNLDTYIFQKISLLIIELKQDKSQIIANLLSIYIYDESDGKMSYGVESNEKNNSSITTYQSSIFNFEQMKKTVHKSIENIIKHLEIIH